MNIQPEQKQGRVPSASTPAMPESVALPISGAVAERVGGDLQRRLLDARLYWCQKNRAHTGQRDEKEGWLAEEEGLHDAALGRERVDLIRLCYPSQVERYRLGFHDGQALLLIPLAAMKQHHFYGGAVPRSPHNSK
ncbi:MAG: hypothetical protein CAF44_009260 [Nitrospira sp. CG24D]|nr:MAG: hypothetical protein CAF44_009260 [Nitrospira sp. CG24D]